MTLKKEDRDILIRYRLDQANDAITVVELLIANDKFNSAVSRIYYCIFYSLLALGLKFEFETS